MNKFREMYLDWANNFLTVEAFAEYYNLTVEQARYVLDSGKRYHEESLTGVK